MFWGVTVPLNRGGARKTAGRREKARPTWITGELTRSCALLSVVTLISQDAQKQWMGLKAKISLLPQEVKCPRRDYPPDLLLSSHPPPHPLLYKKSLSVTSAPRPAHPHLESTALGQAHTLCRHRLPPGFHKMLCDFHRTVLAPPGAHGHTCVLPQASPSIEINWGL